MASTIVIKVKYEKTIRRFNADIVDGRLVLDMKTLRAKVISLLDFAPDAEFALRYTDEDGDTITLVDEDDLLDVVKQSLNPLRISVKLNTNSTVKKHDSGTSTPTVSTPLTPQPLSEILNSLVREAMKVSKVLSKQHKNPPQALTEIVDSFRKVVAEFQASAESSPKSGGASVGKPDLSVKKDAKVSLKPKVVGPSANSNSGATKLKLRDVTPSTSANIRDELQKAGLVNLPPPLDLNVKAPDAQFNWWPNVHPYVTKEKSNKYPSGSANVGSNIFSECPFSGNVVRNENGYASLPQYGPQWHPRIVHYNVECDGCGVQPIEGMRFKSVVKHNYDLCSSCYAKEGNERDYVRIVMPRGPFSSGCPWMNQSRSQIPQAWPKPHVLSTGGAGMKGGDLKLDSCFIQDVNILDGTIMSPSTPFTKIWRMKNNGTMVWPRGTHLMWIGGDKFSKTVSVELEIPAIGLPVEGELDVAIDFCAPEIPGRYISYWRLASPSGQKFGQRVWVLIQVDASLTDPELPKDQRLQNNLGFNLNLPPPTNSSINSPPQVINVNVDDPMVKNKSTDANPERSNKGKEELVEPLVEAYTNKDEELNFPINDTLLVGGGAMNPTSPAQASSSSSTVSYPVVDLSKLEPISHYTSLAATNVPVPAALTTTTLDEVELKLLRELEEMGFKQLDLNKEILKKNEYDLQLSVDDLCGVEEWDPILDELKEMGFCDDEVNKRLLKKNNGSIKRVVMDLINGE